MDFNFASQVKCRSLNAVVTRANGTVEDLGIISYWHRNAFKHYAVNAYIKVRDYLR